MREFSVDQNTIRDQRSKIKDQRREEERREEVETWKGEIVDSVESFASGVVGKRGDCKADDKKERHHDSVACQKVRYL